MSDTPKQPLTPNEALDLMGKFLDLATKRGAFNLLETEQIIRAISTFRVNASDEAPAPAKKPEELTNVTTI
jgi:hypothetical protein